MSGRRLALALLLAVGAAREGLPGAETIPSHCPFQQANMEESGLEPRGLRAAGNTPPPPGIRFSHLSEAGAGAGETHPAPHQETRMDSSAFRPWELVQLLVIVASALAVVWLAHRKLED